MADADALYYRGLVQPDRVIRDVIASRLDELLADTTRLEGFFVGFEEHERDSFLNYLTKRDIGVRIGFSQQLTYEAPQVVISAAQSVDDRSLGNNLKQAIVNIPGLTAEVAADFTVTRQRQDWEPAQTLEVTNVVGDWPTTGIIDVGGEIMSYEGDLTSGTIDILRRGCRDSIISAHAAGASITREIQKTIYGVDQKGSYWIDVCHLNSNFVQILALIVQLALLRAEATDDLTKRGVLGPFLTVTDLAPHRLLYPTTAMVRSLHLTCRYEIALDQDFELIHRPEATGTVVVPPYIGDV